MRAKAAPYIQDQYQTSKGLQSHVAERAPVVVLSASFPSSRPFSHCWRLRRIRCS
jgi:hypothetical protein